MRNRKRGSVRAEACHRDGHGPCPILNAAIADARHRGDEAELDALVTARAILRRRHVRDSVEDRQRYVSADAALHSMTLAMKQFERAGPDFAPVVNKLLATKDRAARRLHGSTARGDGEDR